MLWMTVGARGSQFANCRPGKLYFLGDGIPKDMDKAIVYPGQSADAGNQYVQYTLGKLCLDQQDREQACCRFCTARRPRLQLDSKQIENCGSKQSLLLNEGIFLLIKTRGRYYDKRRNQKISQLTTIA